MKDGIKFYLMNGRDALTTICFWVKNKTGSHITPGFYNLIRLFFISFTDLSNVSCSKQDLRLYESYLKCLTLFFLKDIYI